MKKTTLMILLILSMPAFSGSIENLCEILKIKDLSRDAQVNGLSPQRFCHKYSNKDCHRAVTYPQAICYIFEGASCADTRSLYDGICRANHGDACSLTRSIGNGVCRSLNGNLCAHTNNIGEGLCRGLNGINCRFVDSDWEISYWTTKFETICPNVQLD